MSNKNIQDGFWDSIVSALPTIGKIVSGLIGAFTADGDGVMRNMSFLGTPYGADSDVGKAVFTMGMDEITGEPTVYLCNTSVNQNDYVVLSTPTQENVDAETIILKELSKQDVGAIFRRTSEGGCDTVALNSFQTNSPLSKNNQAVVYASNRCLKVTDAEITSGVRIPLGSFLTVEVLGTELKEIKIAMDGAAANSYAISTVNTLNIEAPNTQITVNPPIQRTEGEDAVIITLPENLKANETYRVSAEVTLQVKGLQSTNRLLSQKLTDAEIQCLKDGKPLISMNDCAINASEIKKLFGL